MCGKHRSPCINIATFVSTVLGGMHMATMVNTVLGVYK